MKNHGAWCLPIRCMQQEEQDRGPGCVPDADKGPVAQLPPPPPAHCVLQRCLLRCSSHYCAAALHSAVPCLVSAAPIQLGSQQSLHCAAAATTRFNCIRGGQWADCCRRGNSNTCSDQIQLKYMITSNTTQVHTYTQYNAFSSLFRIT